MARDQFQTQEGMKLFTHSQRKIVRHKKVQGTASPYDGNLIYWATRLYDHTLTASIKGKLIKLQKGRCAWCGLYLKPGDILQIDHVIPTSLGGRWEVRNLSVYHKHCHDQKSAKDGSHDPERRAEYQEQVSSMTKG